MKVLLIQPRSSWKLIDDIYLNEPLALEYLGAGLKLDNHTVRIHDARLEPDYVTAFQDMEPDIVGLTGFTSHVLILHDMAAKLKQIRPSVFIVVGGHHATLKPEDFNHSDRFDVIVMGEGVDAMREIAHAYQEKKPLEEIRGIALPGSPLHKTPKRPKPILDELPFPDRSLTTAHRKKYFTDWIKPVASIRTSIGCPERCTFCSAWSVVDGKYLRRTPEGVVDELKTLREKHIYFTDDESMLDHRRMHKLADRIKQEGLKKTYFCYARVDTIVRYPELFEKWKKIGLSTVFVGFESYSNDQLNAMNKRVNVEQQEEAIAILHKLGIFIFSQFIVDPAYDKDDFTELVHYIHRLQLKYASFTVLTPLPGTVLYQQRQQELQTHNPELYDVFHTVLPTRLSLEEFYEEYANLYIRSVRFGHGIRHLMRYGWRRIIPQIKHGNQFLQSIRNAYKDHLPLGEGVQP